ncbi:gastrulation defective protein 1 homolog [Coccinella septempunctata]|uniref:gastrulation defective protein 1 homolog n=1 Tax=Coccinella septempunctata TaxID=41139 RepID=UPI001D095656|nr:gastrulation defective protein 1 homolog [Coccinella septempunctata]
MSKNKITFGKISANFGQNSKIIEASGSIGQVSSFKVQEIQNLDDEAEREKEKIQNLMGITSFGKKAKSFDVQEMMEQVIKSVSKEPPKPPEEAPQDEEESEDEDFIGPPIPADLGNPAPKTEEDKDEEDSDNEDIDSKTFVPCSQEATLVHGNKAVTALNLDPSGARLASGSVDYDVSFWDFAGMDSNLRSFRTLQPAENHPIRGLYYSGTGDLLLVISGASQAKVLDRDGFEKLETVKGDMYITDQARTKGHTAGLFGGGWNPVTREEFMTSSADGTVRTWDFYNGGKNHKAIIKCRAQNGLKVTPTSVTYNREGKVLGCGCADGSIQLWDLRKSSIAPATQLRKAHLPTEISSIKFSYIGNYLLTRSLDSTMKLWDIRSMKKCIKEVGDLFTRYDTTDAIFSPNDEIAVTGHSLDKGQNMGSISFYSIPDLNLIKNIPVTNSHTIKLAWHPKLNQIFVGTGNGLVKCFYDDKVSLRGATLCASKIHRKAQHSEIVSTQQVLTPHALPLFRQERRKTSRKQMEKDRLDPVKSRRPDLPITSGQGGRVASSGSTLSSFVIRNLGLSKRVNDDQDPREAILKYAKDAAENPYWITPAYAKTQPKNILDDSGTSEEPPEKKNKPD